MADANRSAFQPFQWIPDPATRDRFPATTIESVQRTHDIAKGVAVCLEMIEKSILDLDDVTPMLNAAHRADLMRFAIASLWSLQDASWQQIEWMNNHSSEWEAYRRGLAARAAASTAQPQSEGI